MKINKNTFCAAPWFQFRYTNLDTYKSCCAIHPEKTQFTKNTHYSHLKYTAEEYLNSDYARYLREKLNNGEKLPECEKCWTQEKYNKKSLRQHINDTVSGGKLLNQSWINAYFKNKKDFNHDYLFSADLTLSFVCNFSCAMCSPQDSSQIYNSWQNAIDQFFVKDIIAKEPSYFQDIKQRYLEKNSYTLLQNVLDQTPKFLKILGGEPLIDKQMLNILKKFEDTKAKKISLIFITNGSVNLSHVAEELSHFKNVMFVVSLEGVGQVQDYIRKGSNWSTIKLNIENFIKHYPKNRISIAYTIQALTLYHFVDLVNWANKLDIKICFNVLNNPDFLSLSAMPVKLKKQIAQRYETINTSTLTYKNDNDVDSKNLDFSEMIIDTTHCPELTTKLLKYLNWYDPDKKWQTILPEWNEFLIS